MSASGGVILIENANPLRAQTIQAIEAARHECVAVEDLAEAMAEARRQRPLMLMLDCSSFMPAEESTLTRLQELRRMVGAPLVLLANLETPTEFIESLNQMGADDCLLKPLRQHQLQPRFEVAATATPRVSPAALGRLGPKVVSLLHGRQNFAWRTGELLEQSGYHVRYGSFEDEHEPPPESNIELHILCAASREELAQVLRLRHPEETRAGSRWFLICPGGPGELVTHSGGGLVAGFDMAQVFPEHVVQKANAWFSRVSNALQPEARVPFFCPVEYREAGNLFGDWNSCYSYDLSPGGIFLRTLVPARPGAAVELKIHLTTHRTELRGSGVVAWANTYAQRKAFSHPVGMGVQFLGMSPKGLSLLRELCGVDPTARDKPE
ncbi:putative response regulator/ggdef domain protein [Cystobacter fuscus DSM 2262]|uniref:Response regulator/ggdef domain protein n=1 Tax=Cystobacter fuscus (strain ATCC 25194 / DSM 2262 / NBRC 100088 / M29) TaxID=1242864 RepID=S9P5J5_CYSF2|nr:PilZ domain-containing protein [Cystobacter fuscus]EPX59715.1 putative response regulator/ggdef domain protein [Cystobacter fuscus DSM 2262]